MYNTNNINGLSTNHDLVVHIDQSCWISRVLCHDKVGLVSSRKQK